MTYEEIKALYNLLFFLEVRSCITKKFVKVLRARFSTNHQFPRLLKVDTPNITLGCSYLRNIKNK